MPKKTENRFLKQCKVHLDCCPLDMLTPALVDYAFTLLGHALTHSLWARSGHLPFPEEDGEQFSKQQTLPLPTCHSPREESR